MFIGIFTRCPTQGEPEEVLIWTCRQFIYFILETSYSSSLRAAPDANARRPLEAPDASGSAPFAEWLVHRAYSGTWTQLAAGLTRIFTPVC